ncbi:hypothetical protein EDM57_04430 [Brevibacillus gelatini]|uniref:Cthe-2314-like HEPN domain-containing protein n=1 Tax=Brevibacillus gelatini TaxID=1655277 RepID=A0A3M8B7H5_9BACL|nr:hypothetical protein [Brevibacillus gelatini]RNB59394.1 hypothetical protein EDM57_04430 [Brevibacillus gelatini]
MRIRGFLHVAARFKLDTLRKFVDDTERNIDFDTQSLINRLEQEASELNEEDQAEYWDYNIDRVHELEKDYPNILRYSILVSCYSTLEKTLVDLHHRLKNAGAPLRKLNHRSLNNLSIIAKVEYCFNNDLSITALSSSKEWGKILHYNKIRNTIVHDLGRVYDYENTSLPEVVAVNQTDFVSFNHLGEIILEKDFSFMLIKDIENFLDLTFEVVYKYRKANSISGVL